LFEVGPDECIKLSDIGIIGRNEVTESSMVYAAPEVLQSCKYSTASDIYSLGLVFWEMWYRSKVFSEILPLEKHEFMAKVVDGYRPQQHDCKITLAKVQTIINYCWAGNEEMRITASRCYTNLVNVLKEFRETNNH
jgi:serine/threonine protein kinase